MKTRPPPIPWGFDRLALEIQKWAWTQIQNLAREKMKEASERLLQVRIALGEVEVEKVEDDLARLTETFKYADLGIQTYLRSWRMVN